MGGIALDPNLGTAPEQFALIVAPSLSPPSLLLCQLMRKRHTTDPTQLLEKVFKGCKDIKI